MHGVMHHGTHNLKILPSEFAILAVQLLAWMSPMIKILILYGLEVYLFLFLRLLKFYH